MRNNNTHFLKIFQTFIFTFCFLIPGFCWGNTSDQIKNGDSFVNYIMFNGESSLIAYYVPETYDSLVPCKMILALHYCGENSASSAIIYRNLLKELAEIINAVIVCSRLS